MFFDIMGTEAAKAGLSQGFMNGIEVCRAAAHGISGGVFSELGGGDFASGFLAGFAGSIAGSVMSSSQFSDVFGKAGQDMGVGQLTMRTVIAGVVGGTAAAIGGGKFMNGAITAAIQHLFNAEGTEIFDDEAYYYTVEARDLYEDDIAKFKQLEKTAETVALITDIEGGFGTFRAALAKSLGKVIQGASDLLGLPLTPKDIVVDLGTETAKMYGALGAGVTGAMRNTSGGKWEVYYRVWHVKNGAVLKDTGWIKVERTFPIENMANIAGVESANEVMDKWNSQR